MIAVSCNESELSHGKIEGLSLIRAEMSIYQRLRNKEENQIVITLYDTKGKQIKNDSLKLYVNGMDMKYTVQQELYYTTTCYFLKNNAPPKDNKFVFEIELADEKKLFLGEVQALALVSPKNIIYEEKGDLNKDFVVKWHDLEGINKLLISRSVRMKKKEAENMTTYEERAADTTSIQSTGSHVVAKSTFDNPEGQISILSMQFVAQYNGKINPLLAEGSYLSIYGEISESVSFEE